jgi:hypothetical protein
LVQKGTLPKLAEVNVAAVAVPSQTATSPAMPVMGYPAIATTIARPAMIGSSHGNAAKISALVLLGVASPRRHRTLLGATTNGGIRSFETAAPDVFGLPRADAISDAATHAPSASFQMVLYDLFIDKTLCGEARFLLY